MLDGGNDHQYRSHFLPGAASHEGLAGDSERANSATIADAHLLFNAEFKRAGDDLRLSIFHQNDGQHQATAYGRNGNNIATISSEGGRLALKPTGLSQIAASEQARTDADRAAEWDAPIISAAQVAGELREDVATDSHGRLHVDGGDVQFLRAGQTITTLSVADLDIGDTLTASIVNSPVVTLDGHAFALPAGATPLINNALSFQHGVTSNGGVAGIGWTYDPSAANLDFLMMTAEPRR